MTYTVDTLEFLTLEFLTGTLGADTELYFVTGADAVLDILTWKDPERVLELCTLIAATRPGYDLARMAEVLGQLGPVQGTSGAGSRVKFMEVPALAISSSMIRERLSSGKAARYLLPDSVAELVEKAGYYAQASDASGAPAPHGS